MEAKRGGQSGNMQTYVRCYASQQKQQEKLHKEIICNQAPERGKRAFICCSTPIKREVWPPNYITPRARLD
jgi:hypothetical protein